MYQYNTFLDFCLAIGAATIGSVLHYMSPDGIDPFFPKIVHEVLQDLAWSFTIAVAVKTLWINKDKLKIKKKK